MAHLHNTTIASFARLSVYGRLAMVSVFLVLLTGAGATAQTNRFLQQGNQLYDQKRYKEAADDYAKALQKDPNNSSGLFNLGNSLYQQKRFDSSRKVLATTEKVSKDRGGKAAASYNIGNSYMSEQKWEDAINSYKRTLRNNPQDPDAKYNLSYAKEMLKKQQEQNKQNKDQKDKQDEKKQDQKKDKQDKDKDKDKNKDQQNKNGDDKDKQDQQPKEGEGQPSKLNQQQAENMLNTLQQQEKKLEDKLKKEKGVPVKLQKDW